MHGQRWTSWPRGRPRPEAAGDAAASSTKARSGESVYNAQTPQAEPVRPTWKNMPLMAMIASLPLAISAFSFFFLSSE